MENDRAFNEIGFRREGNDKEDVDLRRELYKTQDDEAKRNADEHEAIDTGDVTQAWAMLCEAHKQWSAEHGPDEHASFKVCRNEDGELLVTVTPMEETKG